VALSRAPVSLVQPVAAGGVVVLAVFSHFHLGERLKSSEWAGVAAAVFGTIGLGATAEEQKPVLLSTWRYVAGGTAVLLLWFLANVLTARRGKDTNGRRAVSSATAAPGSTSSANTQGKLSFRVEEILVGSQAGTFFSLSASVCKVGLTFGARHHFIFTLLGITAGIALTSVGLVCQTRGLKDGNTIVICMFGNVAQMVAGLIFGVLLLGESLPTRSWALCLWWGVQTQVSFIISDRHPC